MLQGILNDPYIQAITNGHPEVYDKITHEDAAKWRKEWMDARAAYIQHKIDNNLYTASLTKQGPGTLIMTGDDTYEGGTTVEGGKLSIVGSHASPIDVLGGTLGGSGSVAGAVDVAGGLLQPGFSPAEAAGITHVPVTAGNVLRVGGDLSVAREGAVAIVARSGGDYTSVQADGDVRLDGGLTVDVERALPRGTVLTVVRGRSVTGQFRQLPNKGALHADGHQFRVLYEADRVTLTVVQSGEAFRAQQAAEKAAFDAKQAADLAAFEAQQAEAKAAFDAEAATRRAACNQLPGSDERSQCLQQLHQDTAAFRARQTQEAAAFKAQQRAEKDAFAAKQAAEKEEFQRGAP